MTWMRTPEGRTRTTQATLAGAAALFALLGVLALLVDEAIRAQPPAWVLYAAFATLHVALGQIGISARWGSGATWAFAISATTALAALGFLVFFWVPLVVVPAGMVVFAVAKRRWDQTRGS